MSVCIMSSVWQRYQGGGGELLLALALADHAHDNGTHIFPSVNSLAKKTRQSERTVQYQLRNMEASGWLVLVGMEGGGRSICREYRISPDWIKGADFAPFANKGCNQRYERVQSGAERVQPEVLKGAIAVAPESSESSVKQSSGIITPDFFEAAWQEYPSRPGASKADSLKAWNARIKNGVVPEILLAGVARYAAYCKAENTDPRFIKQPATFFGPGGHYLSAWAIPPPAAGKVVKFDPVAHVNRNRNPENEPIDITPQSVA